METPTESRSQNQLSVAQKPMHNRAVVMAVVLFILIVLGMFAFAYLKNKERLQSEQTATTTTSGETDNRYSAITQIDGTHYYIDGVHTIVGEVAMPTPCDLLTANATVAESFPEQITLTFTVVNNADFCAAVGTPARFSVSATASKDAAFNARFNDRPVELNLIPAAFGERPEDFEVFIKG